MAAYVEAEKKEEGTYKKYREVLRETALRLSRNLGAELVPGGAERFADSVPDWPAFPDTAQALKDLGTKGYGRYILSNVDTDLLQRTIDNSRLEVDGFVTAEQVRSYKPAIEHWNAFMKRTGAKKEEILHVAQSIYHDIIPAQGLGITSAWVNRYEEPLPRSARPVYIVDSVQNLVTLLD